MFYRVSDVFLPPIICISFYLDFTIYLRNLLVFSSYVNFQASHDLTLIITKVTRKFIICFIISLTGFQCCCRISIYCLTGFQCLFQNSVHISCFRIITVFFLSRNFLLSLILFEPGLATRSVTSSGRRTAPSRVLVICFLVELGAMVWSRPHSRHIWCSLAAVGRRA